MIKRLVRNSGKPFGAFACGAGHVIPLLAVAWILFWHPTAQAAEMPWKTTTWQVACTGKIQSRAEQGVGQYESVIKKMLEDPEAYEKTLSPMFGEDRDKAREWLEEGFQRLDSHLSDLCRPGSELMQATAHQLEQASDWLRELGFNGPDLAVSDEEVESLLFPASLIDCVAHYCGAFEMLKGLRGVYRGGSFLRIDVFIPSLLFPVPVYGIDQVSINARNVIGAYTPVHELFHAVQAGSGKSNRSAMFRCETDWLSEGSARYAQWVAARKWGALRTSEPAERFYDDSLHEPPVDCTIDRFELDPAQRRRLQAWKYGSWGFWHYLGKRTRTRDEFEYLATVLRQDISAFNGLHGTHQAMTNWHPRGLYQFYPEFARDHLDKERYFSDQGLKRLRLPWPDEPKKKPVADTVGAVATHAFDVRIEVPAGKSAVLRIRIVDDDEDLHLVVDDQLLSQDDSQQRRNLHEAVLVGRGEEFRRFVRVANIAPNPVTTVRTAYNLEFELIPVEPCEAEHMSAAVNADEFPGAAILSSHDPGEGSGFRPGGGSLSIRGLVDDDGHACVHPLSALDMTGSFLSGHADEGAIEETMRSRAQQMRERLEGMDLERLRSMGSGEAGMSPDQMAELMELAGEFEDMGDVLAPPDDQDADVVLHVYSPHEWIHRQGILPPPRATRHPGLAGWQQNAAATLVLQLPDTGVSDLEDGKTYPARAHSPASRESEQPQIVPTLAAFHSAWQGSFHPVPYPPPENDAQARRQERLKADCRQRRRMAEQIGEQMEAGASRVVEEMLSRGDCEHKGLAFEGRTQVVTGSLTGEVHVERVTAAGVKGRFSVTGTGERETTTYTLVHDDRSGALTGDRKEISRQSGPIAIEGEFFAPVAESGSVRASGGYRTVSLPDGRHD